MLDGGPGPREFEDGARHDRIRYAMGFAIRDMIPARPPSCRPCGSWSAASARGQGTGTAAVAALVGCLSAAPGIRRITAVTGAGNLPSRRLLERLGFRVDGSLPDTGEVRYGLSV